MEESPYAPAISALREKIRELENAIQTLETMDGDSGSSAAAVPSSAETDAGPPATREGQIRSDTFFRMSITESVVKCLEINKRPMSTRDMAEMILSGGYITESKRFANLVYTGLRRLADKGRVVRLKKTGTWGLAEWYPNRPRPTKRNGSLGETSDDEE